MSKTLSGNTPKYTNFNDLHKAYGFNYKDKNDRADLTEEEERSFVNDCFDLYEYIGFAETFQSPFESGERDNGKKFTVLRRAEEFVYGESEGADTCDLSCLPMWIIEFEDGRIEEALPEEICKAELEEEPIIKKALTNKKIAILTLSSSGEICLIETDHIDSLIKDRFGYCKFSPSINSKVFFASLNGVPVNPYFYTNYPSLLDYLETAIKGENFQ